LHFTARLFTNEGELEYNSQTNNGWPHISHPHQPNSTPAHLTDLNGRPAHLYVYQLREMIETWFPVLLPTMVGTIAHSVITSTNA
jgi:hypothetical protein